MEDNGLLHKPVLHIKTQEICNGESSVGAYWVHSKDRPLPWDKVRALIIECEDLPQVARDELVRLGDKAVGQG